MKDSLVPVKKEEQAVFTMRSLYEKYGYSQFKMSQFEEYELYVRNKDFLVSDNIITFTDADGKLMALKPDVTLSIIKNSSPAPGCVQKVYYNENVYRVPKGTRSFKEILQTGLECIGDVDEYSIYEVLMLAAESLESISPDYVLDISHLGVISSVIDRMGLSDSARTQVLKCIGEKNVRGIAAVCETEKADAAPLTALVSAYGSLEKVRPVLQQIGCAEAQEAIQELETVVDCLEKAGYKDKVRIDFSVINDMSYYNGFLFKGFIKGICTGVLSGGQYDRLMEKMGKSAGAIGFAVYLDTLERLAEEEKSYDVDTLLLYDADCELSALNNAMRLLNENGQSVMAQKRIPEKLKYRQLLKLNERGVEILESHA